MVSIFAQRSQTDSAIFYALQAAHSTGEPRFLDLRKAALFTAGRLQQGANRAADAEATFREYLRLAPRDLPAMGALGAVLALQNKTADANVVYDSLMVFADTVTDSDVLFDAATELVRARRYPLAARLYERELTFNRCHRDALYNLASTYNAMQDSVHMLAIARRLAEIDPMNRGSLAMLAQAYVFRRDTASIGTLQRLQGLPWDFEFAGFTPAGDTSVTLGGAISNLQDRPLPAFRLTIEFLNGACEPVSSAVVEVPEIPANGRSTVEARGRGRGIKAFRYTTN
jgi:tetratricopeptide (TPR) repeat protein